jgi:hypothetical protein
MYLTGLTHRDRLFDVASRWLADRVEPDDGRVVTEIFAFERILTAPTVRAFVGDLCRSFGPGPLGLERVFTKDAVREAIVAAATDPTPRVRELVRRYHELPEEFFPRTPVYISLVTRGDGRLVAMVRRKRLRRIADKCSRRVAEQLAGEINSAARDLAERRARDAGVSLEQLVSPTAVMDEEFAAAERIVADRLRRLETTLDAERQRVDDVIGVKVVCSPAELERVEAAIAARPCCAVRNREVHAGSYRATHLAVDLELPPAAAVIADARSLDWRCAAGRGLDTDHLEAVFADYVASAARWFRVELILTTFEDLVESELGRSIHEVRIQEQRERTTYSGRIAQNASSIIEYLLHLAVSPTVTVTELPIKVWGRYLRDTVAHAIALLHGARREEWLINQPGPGVTRLSL